MNRAAPAPRRRVTGKGGRTIARMARRERDILERAVHSIAEREPLGPRNGSDELLPQLGDVPFSSPFDNRCSVEVSRHFAGSEPLWLARPWTSRTCSFT